MGLPTDEFKCRSCGEKHTDCSDGDISLCAECGNDE